MFSFKKVNLLGIFSGCQKLLLRHESTSSSGFKVTRHGYVYEENPNQVSETDRKITQDVLFKVNQQIKNNTHGRLFAVIQLGARKFKITNEDIIALNEYFPANVGERLRLEKVLLVGSSDFTLLGRPVLSKDLVRIEATVIEKTFIVPRPVYRHGRVRYKRLYWFRTPYVLFCINSIEFLNSLDTLPAIENVDNRVPNYSTMQSVPEFIVREARLKSETYVCSPQEEKFEYMAIVYDVV